MMWRYLWHSVAKFPRTDCPHGTARQLEVAEAPPPLPPASSWSRGHMETLLYCAVLFEFCMWADQHHTRAVEAQSM